MYHQINQCRVCGNKNLVEVLDLGDQALTGVFPHSKDQHVTSGPLKLVKCSENNEENSCGLLQLKHNYDLNELYGTNYGYRSSLNKSMVNHLHDKVRKICNIVKLNKDDIVVDIGSNDGTTLSFYPNDLNLLGIDPTAEKFSKYYPSYTTLIPDFFNVSALQPYLNGAKAKVVTSFSMFYDLEDPVSFAQDVTSILDKNGIWVCEQSYMPTMLKQNSFDTICHEHLEYYGLRQIHWIAEKVGLKIIDVEFNDINGGSFSVAFAHKSSNFEGNYDKINHIIQSEIESNLNTVTPYLAFAERVADVKRKIRQFFNNAKEQGHKVYGLGASTKGNVILQYCGLTEFDLPLIGEVNSDKFGCYTPGTLIPIIPEAELLAKQPDFIFILPWHFAHFFNQNESISCFKLCYPLPELNVSQKECVI